MDEDKRKADTERTQKLINAMLNPARAFKIAGGDEVSREERATAIIQQRMDAGHEEWVGHFDGPEGLIIVFAKDPGLLDIDYHAATDLVPHRSLGHEYPYNGDVSGGGTVIAPKLA